MLKIFSPAFCDGDSLPAKYTCDGENCSPPLSWRDVPHAAQSLVLIVDDPDARTESFVHWLIYNLPPETQGLIEAVDELPIGAVAGLNDQNEFGYCSPCPPSGRHRYVFKLYALDTWLPELGMPTKTELEEQIDGFVLEQAMLTVYYERQ